MEESAARPGCPEFDVYGAMDWTDGVGTLPGSELKFRVNEFGVLEVITEDAEPEGIKKAHATTTWAIPTAQEAFSASAPGKEGGPELPWARPGLVCVRCHRKGSSVDFLADGRHCSERCLRQDQQDSLPDSPRFWSLLDLPGTGREQNVDYLQVSEDQTGKYCTNGISQSMPDLPLSCQ